MADVSSWIDDFALWPHGQILGTISHNLRPVAPLAWESSMEVGGSWTRVGTKALTRPSDWWLPNTVPVGQLHRFIVDEDNIDNPFFGELVLGQPVRLGCAVTPVQTHHIDHRISVPRALGGFAQRGLAAEPRRVKQLSFQLADTPSVVDSADGFWKKWYAEFGQRVLGGEPVLLVPNEDREEVLFGHLPPTITESDGAPGQSGYKRVESVSFEELPHVVEL